MTFGLVISVVLHASLLGFALVSVASTPPREPKLPSPEPIVADVISASDLNRMRKGVREAKLEEAMAKDVKKPDEAKKDTPKPKPIAAQPPPPAAAEPPPPTPEPPKPVEVAKAEPPPPAKTPEPPKPEPDTSALDQKLEELALQKAAEEKAAAEAKAAADAKSKAEADAKAKAAAKEKADKLAKEKADKLAKEKADKLAKEKAAKLAKEKADKLAKLKEMDAKRIAALLDKTPDSKQAPAANEAPTKPTTAKGPVRGDAQGKDTTISANEASFLAGLMRQAVSRCWNINAGLDGIQQMVVKVEVRLTRDGRLSGQPRVVNTQSSPVFRDAADSAVRALVQCEPYVLPPDKYEGGWEHMILTFDPARMF